MPFGKYDPIVCENPECEKKFVPETPWQRHCCQDCRNHCTYIRVTLPKRILQYEKLITSLSGNPGKHKRVTRLRGKVTGYRSQVKVFMAGLKGR